MHLEGQEREMEKKSLAVPLSFFKTYNFLKSDL